MSRPRKSAKPSSPVDIARRRAAEREKERAAARDPSQWGIDKGALSLPVNDELTTSSDKAGGAVRVRRQDVFDLFHGRGKLSAVGLDAVRRLQGDVAILHRVVSSGGDYSPRVDRTRMPAGFTDQRLRAGRRIQAVLGLAGPASAALLEAICEAEVALGQPSDWRATVRRVSGESLADAQGAILRNACDNLAGAYRLIDRVRVRGE